MSHNIINRGFISNTVAFSFENNIANSKLNIKILKIKYLLKVKSLTNI